MLLAKTPKPQNPKTKSEKFWDVRDWLVVVMRDVINLHRSCFGAFVKIYEQNIFRVRSCIYGASKVSGGHKVRGLKQEGFVNRLRF